MENEGRHLFTSESVTEGHPDKIADQISDGILDALIGKDPLSRVACETLVTTGLCLIAGEITTELASLGIPRGIFEVIIGARPVAEGESLVHIGPEWYGADETGMDEVEYFVSANVGEDPKPLVKVASGGEISRIMLAIKMILAKSDALPMLIFDEIDSGVSGRIAQAVGRSMKKLSRYHQVVAITHLPQIAGCADTHYVVEKTEEKKRTFTTTRELTPDERVKEVAKLMSGTEISGAALKSARELIDNR